MLIMPASGERGRVNVVNARLRAQERREGVRVNVDNPGKTERREGERVNVVNAVLRALAACSALFPSRFTVGGQFLLPAFNLRLMSEKGHPWAQGRLFSLTRFTVGVCFVGAQFSLSARL